MLQLSPKLTIINTIEYNNNEIIYFYGIVVEFFVDGFDLLFYVLETVVEEGVDGLILKDFDFEFIDVKDKTF